MGLTRGLVSESNYWQDGIFYEKQEQNEKATDEDLAPSHLLNQLYVSMTNNSTLKRDQEEAFEMPFIQMNISTFDVSNGTASILKMDDDLDNVFNFEPWRDVLSMFYKPVMGSTMLMIMFSMGCTLYWRKVLKGMRQPVGILIGMLCQFVLLPAVGFGLTRAMALGKYETLGVLIMSCAPGGGMSNFVTYQTDGDLTLSIVMTTVSSIMAMVVMPSNLWLYSHFMEDKGEEPLVIPYMNLTISLIAVVVPVMLGMLIRTWLPKIAAILVKVLSIVTYGLLSCTLGMFGVLYYPIYSKASVFLVTSALLLPILGFTTSYLVAMVLRQTHQRARTIGVETGSQNVPCVISIILFSFTDQKTIAYVIVFPSLYGLITIALLLLGTVFFKLWKQYCSNKEKGIEDEIENGVLLKEKSISVVKRKTNSSGDDIVTVKNYQ